MNLTRHSVRRAKERLSITRPSLRIQAITALTRGVSLQDTRGRLREYLKERSTDETVLRVYGEVLYIFNTSESLLTVYKIPQEYSNHIKYAKTRKNKGSLLGNDD